MAISFRPLRCDSVQRYRVAASQTIAVGDPVVMNASGLVEVGAAASTQLLGVAAEAITTGGSVGVTDTIGVFDDPAALFIAKGDAATTGSQALIGDEVDLVGSTGAFFVDIGASATDVFVVRAIGAFYDPLLDGTTDYKWTDGLEIVVQINKHTLANGR
jgi:hypothetical protein